MPCRTASSGVRPSPQGTARQWSGLRGRPVRQRHAGGLGLAGPARPADRDLVARVVLLQRRLQRGRRGDGVAVDRGDHVTRGEASAGGRRSLEYPLNRRARARLDSLPGRVVRGLDLDAEEAGGADVHRGRGLARLYLVADRERVVDRDRERIGLLRLLELHRVGGRGVDADHLAGGVDQRPARVPRLDRSVVVDQPGQLLRRARALVRGGDRFVERGYLAGGDRRRAALALRVAERDHLLADRGGVGVAELHGLQARGALQLQHGDVLGLVVADDLGRVALAVADIGHLDRGCAFDHVVVGQDLAVRGQHQPGAQRLGLLVAERGGHVDEGGIHLRFDLRCGQGRPRSAAARAAQGKEGAQTGRERHRDDGRAASEPPDRTARTLGSAAIAVAVGAAGAGRPAVTIGSLAVWALAVGFLPVRPLAVRALAIGSLPGPLAIGSLPGSLAIGSLPGSLAVGSLAIGPAAVAAASTLVATPVGVVSAAPTVRVVGAVATVRVVGAGPRRVRWLPGWFAGGRRLVDAPHGCGPLVRFGPCFYASIVGRVPVRKLKTL